MSNIKLGVQLWTLHKDMEKNVEETLRKVSEMGFEGIEFSHVNYDGMSPDKTNQLLKNFNLEPIARHLGGYEAITTNIDREIEFSKKLGCEHIVFSLMDKERREDESLWKQALEDLEKAGEKCKEQGVTFCYHNHEFELQVIKNGKPMLDSMLETLPKDVVSVELDAGWIFHGGADPISYINKYAGRVPMVHLKDISSGKEGDELTVELGKGEVNLKGVITAASNAGAKWVVYEQDYCKNPPMVSVANSMKWLKNHFVLS